MLCAALGPAGPARQRAHEGTPRQRAQVAAEKQSLHASEQDPARVQQARAAYREETAGLDPERFTCIDASGVNLAMTRRDGRAPQGERVVGAVPQNYGAQVTRLAALGSHSVEAVMTLEGATDAEGFRVSVEQGLRPTRRPGDIVLRANLRAPKAVGIREASEQTGARRQYLPPYSPELSPIARCWSKLKTVLRTATARTREALEQAIAQALGTMTAADARSWVHHCGYALQ